tara:strand:+ start:3491 stop:3700 length:210 start_codon:yes stop_codon:yes gene_type:complete
MSLNTFNTDELESMCNTLDERLEFLENSIQGDSNMEILTKMINMSRVYTATKVYLELKKDFEEGIYTLS